jgi:hypothetical protein
MGEIRSSWEIAREKADELGELSEEEQRRQQEEKCLPIGKSLADNYLDKHDALWLEKELAKYPTEDRELIRQIALHQLVDYIDVQNSFVFDRVGLGIISLAKDSRVKGIVDKMEGLFHDYQEVEKIERQKIEAAGREMLHQQRISGTAIKMINVRAREEWQNKLNELAYPYNEQLNNFKQKLLAF